MSEAAINVRPACFRCGGRTRKDSGFDLFTCRQEQGPCGYRWVRFDGREFFQRSRMDQVGKEWYWSSPEHTNKSGDGVPNSSYPSAAWGAALMAGTKVLEIVVPNGR